MLYSENIKKAALLSYKAHEGQYDKGGYPYFMHPLHLAEQMDTEDEIITALLHDVIEDTDITLEELIKEGFSSEVISALRLLTRSEGEDYMEYVKKIKKAGGIALKIKLADLEHNMTFSRVGKAGERDKKRMEKYAKAIEILKN